MSQLFNHQEIIISNLARHAGYLKEIRSASDLQPAPDLNDPIPLSSLGLLSLLPPELITIILGMLDVLSLVRFGMVSHMGHAILQTYRKYRELMTAAPNEVATLGRLGLLSLHSVQDLHRALRREKCAYCPFYGANLFLLSCERACWHCLGTNPSLRLISGADARRYFGLSKEELTQLPSLVNFPGSDRFVHTHNPSDHTLFSVNAAKDLALINFGSVERLAEAMSERCTSAPALDFGGYLLSRPIPQDRDPILEPTSGYARYDFFFDGTSIPFPSLSYSGGIDHGLLCLGCEHTRMLLDRSRLPQEALATIVPPNCEPRRVIYGLQMRAWSRDSFLDHVLHCYGASQLAPWLARLD